MLVIEDMIEPGSIHASVNKICVYKMGVYQCDYVRLCRGLDCVLHDTVLIVAVSEEALVGRSLVRRSVAFAIYIVSQGVEGIRTPRRLVNVPADKCIRY